MKFGTMFCCKLEKKRISDNKQVNYKIITQIKERLKVGIKDQTSLYVRIQGFENLWYDIKQADSNIRSYVWEEILEEQK